MAEQSLEEYDIDLRPMANANRRDSPLVSDTSRGGEMLASRANAAMQGCKVVMEGTR